MFFQFRCFTCTRGCQTPHCSTFLTGAGSSGLALGGLPLPETLRMAIALYSILARIHARFFPAFLPLGSLSVGFQDAGKLGMRDPVYSLFLSGFVRHEVRGASRKARYGLPRKLDVLFYTQADGSTFLWKFRLQGLLPIFPHLVKFL